VVPGVPDVAAGAVHGNLDAPVGVYTPGHVSLHLAPAAVVPLEVVVVVDIAALDLPGRGRTWWCQHATGSGWKYYYCLSGSDQNTASGCGYTHGDSNFRVQKTGYWRVNFFADHHGYNGRWMWQPPDQRRALPARPLSWLAGSPGPPGADFAVLGGLGSGVGGGVVGGVGSGVGGGVVGGVRASGGVLCAGPGLLM
jgi:hypothetical protein